MVELRAPGRIRVEVAYVEPGRQFLRGVDLDAGATIADAIAASGVAAAFPHRDIAHSKVGVFSRPATLESVLRDGDRVEIYRPLLIDPKEARRQRAQKPA
ncbi:MAG TPA: RnfH family protein [Tahibacter sp.]|jgi:putative ubiquitin-RnfH superfamily antitoxin RatB of RatAB toxin-antitoxin module|nr:RnfH family protein [Tahibacter sp.]